MSTLRSSPSFARQDYGAFMSRSCATPASPFLGSPTGQLPSAGNSAAMPVAMSARPAADLSFGDARFGFVAGRPGL